MILLLDEQMLISLVVKIATKSNFVHPLD